MDDTISRAAALNVVEKMYKMCEGNLSDYHDLLVACFTDLTPAQPKTAKRIVSKSRDGMTLWYQCDMCNEPVDAQDAFCRGCGRRLTDG